MKYKKKKCLLTMTLKWWLSFYIYLFLLFTKKTHSKAHITLSECFPRHWKLLKYSFHVHRYLFLPLLLSIFYFNYDSHLCALHTKKIILNKIHETMTTMIMQYIFLWGASLSFSFHFDCNSLSARHLTTQCCFSLKI